MGLFFNAWKTLFFVEVHASVLSASVSAVWPVVTGDAKKVSGARGWVGPADLSVPKAFTSFTGQAQHSSLLVQRVSSMMTPWISPAN